MRVREKGRVGQLVSAFDTLLDTSADIGREHGGACFFPIRTALLPPARLDCPSLLVIAHEYDRDCQLG